MDFDKSSIEEEYAGQDRYRIVICGANSYDKKYYFNKKFDNLPTNIKEELHIICVLFTEEAGGIFTISFTPFGHIEFDTRHEEGDLLYDEISALFPRDLPAPESRGPDRKLRRRGTVSFLCRIFAEDRIPHGCYPYSTCCST